MMKPHLSGDPQGDGNGFTLIELSIVLTIIALIIGGVLIRRDLIKSAQIRSQITQLQMFDIAANTFLERYNCLSGDCPNATNLGFARYQYGGCSDPFIANGNGDGKIGSGIDLNAPGVGNTLSEIKIFWDQLTDAKLLNSPYTDSCQYSSDNIRTIPGKMPNVRVLISYYSDKEASGVYGSWGVPGNYYSLVSEGQGCYESGSGYVGEVLTPSEAFQIDSKIDNGIPNAGKVYASQGCGQDPDNFSLNFPSGYAASVAPLDCTNTTGSVYADFNINNKPNCTLNIKTGF